MDLIVPFYNMDFLAKSGLLYQCHQMLLGEVQICFTQFQFLSHGAAVDYCTWEWVAINVCLFPRSAIWLKAVLILCHRSKVHSKVNYPSYAGFSLPFPSKVRFQQKRRGLINPYKWGHNSECKATMMESHRSLEHSNRSARADLTWVS